MRELVIRMTLHGLWYLFMGIMTGYPMIAIAILGVWVHMERHVVTPFALSGITRFIMQPLLVYAALIIVVQVLSIENLRKEFGISLFIVAAVYFALRNQKTELSEKQAVLTVLTYIGSIVAGAVYLPNLVPPN